MFEDEDLYQNHCLIIQSLGEKTNPLALGYVREVATSITVTRTNLTHALSKKDGELGTLSIDELMERIHDGDRIAIFVAFVRLVTQATFESENIPFRPLTMKNPTNPPDDLQEQEWFSWEDYRNLVLSELASLFTDKIFAALTSTEFWDGWSRISMMALFYRAEKNLMDGGHITSRAHPENIKLAHDLAALVHSHKQSPHFDQRVLDFIDLVKAARHNMHESIEGYLQT